MSQGSEKLIGLKGAGINDGAVWLVREVDLSVHRREIVTLIGPNGSGKSTTAKLALKLLVPTQGQSWQKPALKVGYVPQKLAIDPSLPLNVERFMRLTGRPSSAEIQGALARTEVAHLVHAPMQHLSGGEFQRVLLARALVRDPELLVLDEPVQGVDFAGQVAMYQLINQIRDEIGCGILLISHDLNIVMASTDRVVCLNGHVCCTGTAQSVTSDPAFRQLFGAKGAEALGLYRHHHDHVHLDDGRVLSTEARESAQDHRDA